MNVYAYRRTQSFGFRYASDTRGTHPFIPVIRAEIVACPQFPTTLPTLDELIGLAGITEGNVAEALLARTADWRDHVFTLHAELEGMKLAKVFEKLVAGWKAQGFEIVAMRDLVGAVDIAKLPLHTVVDSALPGRSGMLAAQGPAFLAEESFP
jgi:undecaprenyl phosphate-alpha-L-ara4FN deformylase